MADFLYDPGTNGFIATPFNLLSTELNALANLGSVTSSVGGTSGVYTQTEFASAPQGAIWFVSGGAFTPTAGGLLRGWFAMSGDGGANFEKLVSGTAMPRAEDFIIPLYANAYASSGVSFAQSVNGGGLVALPAMPCKIYLISEAGATLPATGNLIKCGPAAFAYSA